MASVAGAFHITLSGRTCEFDTIKEVLGTIERFFFFSFLKDSLSRPLRFCHGTQVSNSSSTNR